MKRILIFLLLASGAYGQNLFHYENLLLNQNGTPITGVSVWICSGNITPLFTSTPPCALASIFSDPVGINPIVQPITTSPLGNYSFFLGGGTYTAAFIGSGIQSSDIITIPGFPGFANLGNKLFENVLYVDSTFAYGGSDMGDEINKAYGSSSCPTNGCEIDIAPSPTGACYNFSTPIILATASKYVLLKGRGTSSASVIGASNGACLNYTPLTTTTAIRLDYAPTNGGTSTRNHGIQNLRLVNNQCTTIGGCSSNAVGISCTSTNGGCQNAAFDHFDVLGFGTGISIATPASNSQASWGINLFAGSCSYNTTCLSIANGIEMTKMVDEIVLGNATGISMGSSSDFSMVSSHCDSNTVICAVSTGGIMSFTDVHFEDCCGLAGINPASMNQVNGGLAVNIKGGFADEDCASAGACSGVTPVYWFKAPLLSVNGLSAFTAGRLPTQIFQYGTTANVTGFINVGNSFPHDNIITTVGGNAVFSQVTSTSAAIESGLFMADSSSGDAMTCGQIGTLTGWGSTGACSSPQGGKQRFQFTMTANGTGITANPVVTITFTNPWPKAPEYQCKMVGGTATTGFVTGENNISANTLGPLAYIGTPSGGQTVIFGCTGI